jgi:hypothetical protein
MAQAFWPDVLPCRPVAPSVTASFSSTNSQPTSTLSATCGIAAAKSSRRSCSGRPARGPRHRDVTCQTRTLAAPDADATAHISSHRGRRPRPTCQAEGHPMPAHRRRQPAASTQNWSYRRRPIHQKSRLPIPREVEKMESEWLSRGRPGSRLRGGSARSATTGSCGRSIGGPMRSRQSPASFTPSTRRPPCRRPPSGTRRRRSSGRPRARPLPRVGRTAPSGSGRRC